MIIIVPICSCPLCEAAVNVTVGVASLSCIVAVCSVGASVVAFVGTPIVTITVSLSSSSRRSLFTVIVMSSDGSPAVMVMGVAVIV